MSNLPQSPYSLLEKFHCEAQAVGLKYLLIGGFAVSFWAMPRSTADVDYVIRRRNLEQAKVVLAQLGYVLGFLHPKESFAHFHRESEGGFRIDLMMVDDETWQKLQAAASFADLGGEQQYPVVSALHLIAMKLHAAKQPDRLDKFKDLNDVLMIMEVQRLEIEDLQSSGILSKHGTEETISFLRLQLESRRNRRSD